MGGTKGSRKEREKRVREREIREGTGKSVPSKEGIDSRIKYLKRVPRIKSRMSVQRIYYISRVALVLVAVCVLTTVVAGQQQDEQKSNNRNSQSLSGSSSSSLSSSSSSFGAAGSSPNNDIYIDDEGLEGSGSRGEIRDDLEKEDDESSGSGYGDDDEDSSSISSSSNSRSNANVGIISRDGGQGGAGGTGTGAGQINNNQLGGGHGGQGHGQAGSGDHADYDDEDDDREDDDLYTETKNPNAVDPSTTDDEDMSTGTGGKDGKSSSSAGTSIKHSPDGDLDLPTLLHSPTNVEGGGHGGTGHGGSGGSGGHDSNNPYGGSGVLIMNAKNEDRTASFFAQPGILAAVIGGAVVGLLCAILVVMFIVYRMRKKDEGSYALDEPKRSPTANTYAKNANNREFYA